MPALSVGNVTTLPAGSTPVAKIVSTSNGYALVLAFPEGYVPKKGTDYWTSEDQQAIKDDVTKIVGDAFAKAKAEVEDAVANGKYQVVMRMNNLLKLATFPRLEVAA